MLFTALLVVTSWWPLTLAVTIPKKQVSLKKLNVCLSSRHPLCSTFLSLPHFPQENVPIRWKSGQSQPVPPLCHLWYISYSKSCCMYSLLEISSYL